MNMHSFNANGVKVQIGAMQISNLRLGLNKQGTFSVQYDLKVPGSDTAIEGAGTSFDKHHPAIGAYIQATVDAAGAKCWEEIDGKSVFVRVEDGVVVGIGNLHKDEWVLNSDFHAKSNSSAPIDISTFRLPADTEYEGWTSKGTCCIAYLTDESGRHRWAWGRYENDAIGQLLFSLYAGGKRAHYAGIPEVFTLGPMDAKRVTTGSGKVARAYDEVRLMKIGKTKVGANSEGTFSAQCDLLKPEENSASLKGVGVVFPKVDPRIGLFLASTLQCIGIKFWSQMRGKEVRVRFLKGVPVGIGHADEELWLMYDQFSKALIEEPMEVQVEFHISMMSDEPDYYTVRFIPEGQSADAESQEEALGRLIRAVYGSARRKAGALISVREVQCPVKAGKATPSGYYGFPGNI
jgi:hypothetical protein